MSEKIKNSVKGKDCRNPIVMKRLIAAVVAMAAIIVVLLMFLAATMWANSGGSTKDDTSKSNTTDDSSKKTAEVKVMSADVSGVIAASDENGNIGDHVRGKADSKVVFVVYADLQCPGCASMAPIIDSFYEEYKDRVAFVYRHYPLSFHELAEPAAKAAEAAGKQGYFWESLSYLYSARASWITDDGDPKDSSNILTSYLASKYSDFSVDKYYAALSDESIAKKIAFDRKIGKEKSYVDATPSMYVNGKAIDISSAKKYESVRALIREAIDEALKNN